MRWYVFGIGVLLSVAGWFVLLGGLFALGDFWQLGLVAGSREAMQDYATVLVIIGLGALCLAASQAMARKTQ